MAEILSSIDGILASITTIIVIVVGLNKKPGLIKKKKGNDEAQ